MAKNERGGENFTVNYRICGGIGEVTIMHDDTSGKGVIHSKLLRKMDAKSVYVALRDHAMEMIDKAE